MHQQGSGTGGLEVLYGRQALLECLRAARRRVRTLWSARGVRHAGTAADILALARRMGVAVQECERRDLDRLTHSGNHQGLAAEVSPYPLETLEDVLSHAEGAKEPVFLLVLDHVQDPQNAGSLLRSADAAGAQGVILAGHRAVGVTPAVVRASSGAAEHLRVACVPNLVTALDLFRRKGIWIYGLEGSPEAQPCAAARMVLPLALVVGSEGAGLSRPVRAKCDALLRLPMRGKVASLNAAVAGALAMFEVRRQREPAPAGPAE